MELIVLQVAQIVDIALYGSPLETDLYKWVLNLSQMEWHSERIEWKSFCRVLRSA